jgi:tellurite resistance protein TerA
LDKQGDSHKVNLSKDKGSQIFHINLQWDQPSDGNKGRGLLGRLFGGGSSEGTDLDLGCMWSDKDGNKGVIQPLGNHFGDKNVPPYILLDKDDRSGAAADGENMYFYRPEVLDRVVVFALIYEGTANFSNVNGRLTILDGLGGEILVPLNAPDTRHTFCAVAIITNNDNQFKIQKEERYFISHKECDQHYGFGFNWRPARK